MQERSTSETLTAADGSRIDVHVRGLFGLHRAEAHPEHGSWFFLRAHATPTAVEIDRAYDSWPSWAGERFGINPGAPIATVAAEMERRDPQWRPEWVRLLAEEVVYGPPADLLPPPPDTATTSGPSEDPAAEDPPRRSGWWRRRRHP
jgi:hypothetical protein